MRINRVKTVVTIGSAIIMLCLTGCNKQDIFISQMNTIETWLNRNDPNREDFTEVSKGVFRSFTTPEDGRGTPIAETGDSLWMMFGIYRFTQNFSGSQNDLLYTNKAELMPDRVTWSRDPLKVTLGSGELMSGVEKALEGCAPGDIVTVIMTSDNAYGKHTVEQLPPNTPIAWKIEIERVVKP